MKLKLWLVTLGAAAALSGTLLGLLFTSAPAQVNLTPLRSQVAALSYDVQQDNTRIAVQAGQLITDDAKIADLSTMVNAYPEICSTTNVPWTNGKLVTEYSPCSDKNPNG